MHSVPYSSLQSSLMSCATILIAWISNPTQSDSIQSNSIQTEPNRCNLRARLACSPADWPNLQLRYATVGRPSGHTNSGAVGQVSSIEIARAHDKEREREPSRLSAARSSGRVCWPLLRSWSSSLHHRRDSFASVAHRPGACCCVHCDADVVVVVDVDVDAEEGLRSAASCECYVRSARRRKSQVSCLMSLMAQVGSDLRDRPTDRLADSYQSVASQRCYLSLKRIIIELLRCCRDD